MKTKETSSSVFSSAIKAISYAANQAQEAILHHIYSNPIQGEAWNTKFSQHLFNRYIPEELLEQVKNDHVYAESQFNAWNVLMHGYERPRCYIDKIGVGDLFQYAVTKKTKDLLKQCQEKVEEDYKAIYKINGMVLNDQKIVLSVNWRLQKIFPNDKIIKQAANNHFYKNFILGDAQIDFIAQNYMDLIRYGWVYK